MIHHERRHSVVVLRATKDLYSDDGSPYRHLARLIRTASVEVQPGNSGDVRHGIEHLNLRSFGGEAPDQNRAAEGGESWLQTVRLHLCGHKLLPARPERRDVGVLGSPASDAGRPPPRTILDL